MSLPPPPHYEEPREFLLQGDIGYFPFVQVATVEDKGSLPDATMPPPKGIPVLEGLSESAITLNGSEYLLRSWYGLGVVVDVTSEVGKNVADTRVTVAPAVPIQASGLNWDTALAGMYVGALALPAADQGSIRDAFPPMPIPDLVVLPRSLSTVSRRVVDQGKLLTLSPRMSAVFAFKLAEMFAERQWGRADHFRNVMGSSLVEVIDAQKSETIPPGGKWVVLCFENHERLQVWAKKPM